MSIRPSWSAPGQTRVAKAWVWLLLLLLSGLCPAAQAAPLPEAALRQALQAEAGESVLRQAYQQRNYRALWVDASGPGAMAETLRELLLGADADGLEPAAYVDAELQRAWGERSPEALARLELMLSRALLRYAHDLARGRDAWFAADAAWNIPRPAFDPLVLLKAMTSADQIEPSLRRLAPVDPHYQALRLALATYRQIARQGGWLPLRTDIRLQRGVRDPEVSMLRFRLMQSGDLAATPDIYDTLFDEALEAAVRHFQGRHGLMADGVVGQKTLQALNTPIAQRIATIRLNMERWRWLPRQLGARYLWVNLPDFSLQVVEEGTAPLDMRVIIGSVETPTPALHKALESVVLNPYWYVPSGLAVDKLLPRQQRDPGFLARSRIRVYSAAAGSTQELDPAQIDWAALSTKHFPYRLIQDPGPQNSMGRIKFMFPNPYAITLHDTPTQALFEKGVRTFSRGCIRIEQPLRLATYLLRNAEGWAEADLQAALEQDRNRWLNLPDPVPIYIVYLTSWVDADGTLNFRDDIYGRDVPGPVGQARAGGTN